MLGFYPNAGNAPRAHLWFQRYGAVVSAAELPLVKQHIRQDESIDTEEDALLTAYIASATKLGEDHMQTPIIRSGYRGFLDAARLKGSSNAFPVFFDAGSDTFSDQRAFTLMPIASAINSVKLHYSDGTPSTTLGASEYYLSPLSVIEFNQSPANYAEGALRNRAWLEIDFQAGICDDLASVPSTVNLAILQTVGFWYENRESVGVVPAGAIELFDLNKLYDLR